MIILHAYTHRGPRIIASSEGLLVVESAHNLFADKSQGGRKSPARKRTPIRFGDHARPCLTLPFDSECSVLLLLCATDLHRRLEGSSRTQRRRGLTLGRQWLAVSIKNTLLTGLALKPSCSGPCGVTAGLDRPTTVCVCVCVERGGLYGD